MFLEPARNVGTGRNDPEVLLARVSERSSNERIGDIATPQDWRHEGVRQIQSASADDCVLQLGVTLGKSRDETTALSIVLDSCGV
jgi:hypothetical protein